MLIKNSPSKDKNAQNNAKVIHMHDMCTFFVTVIVVNMVCSGLNFYFIPCILQNKLCN